MATKALQWCDVDGCLGRLGCLRRGRWTLRRQHVVVFRRLLWSPGWWHWHLSGNQSKAIAIRWRPLLLVTQKHILFFLRVSNSKDTHEKIAWCGGLCLEKDQISTTQGSQGLHTSAQDSGAGEILAFAQVKWIWALLKHSIPEAGK